MELAGGGGHDRESWIKAREEYLDDPLGFCLSDLIPRNAQSQYLTYMTPELWQSVGIDLGMPQPELFDDAFALCDSIRASAPELRAACFGGFGKEFVPLALGRDIRAINSFGARESALVEDWCSRAEAADGVRSCIHQAVQSLFWGGENDPEITFRFCAAITSGVSKDSCYAELDSAIASYTRDNVRMALCSRLPETYRRSCAQNQPR